MQLPKIGMRNIKTAVSVFLLLFIFNIIDRDNSFYACIAAIICMQQTVENTFSKGISRIIGTVIGGLVGVIMLIAANTHISETVYLFLIPIGIIVLIEICVLLKQNDAASICCIVFLSIMLNHRFIGDFLSYTLDRVIDTSVGIIIAVMVNRYLKMPDFIKKMLSNTR